MKKRHERLGKGNHTFFFFIEKCQRARTRHNKVCKVDHIMKFQLNVIRYNEAKPIHFFFFPPLQSGTQ